MSEDGKLGEGKGGGNGTKWWAKPVVVLHFANVVGEIDARFLRSGP